MKQKLLTLVTLLLCAVTSSWAETLFSATGKAQYSVPASTSGTEISSDYATVSGGKMYVWNGQSEAKTLISSQGPSGSKKFAFVQTNSDTYFKLSLNSALETGDVISVYLYPNNSSNRGIWLSNSTSRPGNATGSVEIVDKGSAWVEKTYTVTAESPINGKTDIYIYRATGNTIYFADITITGTRKEISTQAFAGVKSGSTTLTEGSDYSIAGNVITLAAAHKSLITPTDIKLINHITYTDASTADKDVAVTFDGTVTDGYFVSDATTIGGTNYTVKVPYDATETLTADKASLSVVSTGATIGTATVTLTGANLTGETSVEWASDVENLSVSPATITLTDGAFNQTFTVSYFSMDAVAETTVNLTFTVGSKSVVVPVTYSSTAATVTTITDVTEATTWDWSETTNDMSSPANGYMIPFGNATDAATKYANTFNYQALAGNAQYFARKNEKCFQGTELKFHTTVAGYITVVFSNTGKDRPYRYLYLNGNKISDDARSASADKVTAKNIHVDDGDVVLSGYIEDATNPKAGNNDVVGPQMLRIYKIIFVPSDPAPYCDFTAYQWATYVPTTAIDFSTQPNVEAYIVTGHDGTAIEKIKVTSVPANTPVLLYKKTEDAGSLYFDSRATSDTDVAANLLKAGTGAAVSAESGKTKYVLSVADGKAVFKKINATAATVVEGKAYLEFNETIDAREFLNLDGETTGIKSVESKKAENNEYYNLAGQQVAAPTKGLYIVNGKKVIIK